jgi:oxygen-independent coproporphyrinogen III oxidase
VHQIQPTTAITPVAPRSAYVHVPFCKQRCGYCNFTLVAGRDDLIEAYLECLAIELSQQLQQARTLETLFIGGGTPTQLSCSQLEQLFRLLRQWLPIESQGEFSVEANPLDCCPEKLQLMRDWGVNRISLGGQSFNDHKLKALERDHTGLQLHRALQMSLHYFDNCSLDLIFAAPDESLDQWNQDLTEALSTDICHLSTYGLTYERGAGFWARMLRGELVEADAELQLAMYAASIDRLAAAGWEHYEISNFCRPHNQCRHNLSYWRGDYWWAFGPGAASFLPLWHTNSPTAHRDRGQRFVRATNFSSTTRYLRAIRQNQSPIYESDELDLEQLIRERLVFGLRQLAGVRLSDLAQQYGQAVEPLFEPYLSRYLEMGLLERHEQQIRLSRKGLYVSDGLWPDLLWPSLQSK